MAGYITALVFVKIKGGRIKDINLGKAGKIPAIIVFSLLGAVLPLDTYGILPLLAVMYAAGLEFSNCTSFLLTNALFNMTVPFMSNSFSWKYGIYRILIAIAAGIIGGLVVMLMKPVKNKLLNENNINALIADDFTFSGTFKLIGRAITFIGPYLIAGVFINVIFNKYILGEMLKVFYSNGVLSSVPRTFASMNVTNHFFLVAINTGVLLINFTKLSSIMFLLKFRGVLLYYIYFVLLILVLSISII